MLDSGGIVRKNSLRNHSHNRIRSQDPSFVDPTGSKSSAHTAPFRVTPLVEREPGPAAPIQRSGKRDPSLYQLGARINANLLQWCCLGAAILFCVAVAFDLNGSSVGMWRELLTEPGPAPGLIFSTPKRIRVDEWCVWTPSSLSQARKKPAFPTENSSLGAGRSALSASTGGTVLSCAGGRALLVRSRASRVIV